MVSICRVLVVYALLVGLGFHSAEAQSTPDHLVSHKAGDLPIILSAPHGGRDEIQGVPKRNGEDVAQFNPRSDVNEKPATPEVRVGVYVDEGAGSSVLDLMATLRQFEEVSVQQVMANDIRSGKLADFDVLIHPGGSGGGQGRHLGEDGRGRVLCFSPHPEKTGGLESLVHCAIDNVKRMRPNQESHVPAE